MELDLEVRNSLNEGQVEELVELYQGEWWSKGRDIADVEEMLSETSLIFAFVEGSSNRLAAFARVLTDGVYIALLLDVIVDRRLRGHGVGKRLIELICSDPRLSKVQSLELVCQPELISFYEQAGFTNRVGGSTLMRRTAAEHLKGGRGA